MAIQDNKKRGSKYSPFGCAVLFLKDRPDKSSDLTYRSAIRFAANLIPVTTAILIAIPFDRMYMVPVNFFDEPTMTASILVQDYKYIPRLWFAYP